MLDLSVSNQEIKINGYDIVRKDRNRHGGGVAIYIRTSINFIIRDDLTDDKSIISKQLHLKFQNQKPNHS